MADMVWKCVCEILSLIVKKAPQPEVKDYLFANCRKKKEISLFMLFFCVFIIMYLKNAGHVLFSHFRSHM